MEKDQNVGISMEQVFALLGKMNEDNQKNFISAIAEIKKPSPLEQEKIDKENAKIAAQQKARLAAGMAEEQGRKNRMASCSHVTVHQGTGVVKHAWRAQVHTPHGEKPYFIPTCQISQCQIRDEKGEVVKFYATPDMLTQGVNLDQYQGLDLERLKAWAKQSNAA